MIHGNRNREVTKERERGDEETGKEAEKDRERNMIDTEIEIEGGNAAWDTERETEKKKR